MIVKEKSSNKEISGQNNIHKQSSYQPHIHTQVIIDEKNQIEMMKMTQMMAMAMRVLMSHIHKHKTFEWCTGVYLENNCSRKKQIQQMKTKMQKISDQITIINKIIY